jgi:hypothetical protein
MPQSSVWRILRKCLRAKEYRLHTLLCWNFLYHSRIILSIGDSMWYLVRKLCCIVIIDSVWANPKIQKAFLSPILAMFGHDCHLAVKSANTQWRLSPKQTWRDSLPIDILLSAVSVLIVALSSSEVQEGLMNYPAQSLVR